MSQVPHHAESTGNDDVLYMAVELSARQWKLAFGVGLATPSRGRTIAAGDSWLDPAVTGRVLSSYRQATPATSADTRHEVLTGRELEVLRAMAAGRTNAEIAEELFISELTVKSHIGRIFTKLDLRDRAAAIVYAYDNGLVQPGG